MYEENKLVDGYLEELAGVNAREELPEVTTVDDAMKVLGSVRNAESKLIGKAAYIKSGWYGGEWGTIKAYDGEFYHIAIADDMRSMCIFERNEFTVRREKHGKV